MDWCCPIPFTERDLMATGEWKSPYTNIKPSFVLFICRITVGSTVRSSPSIVLPALLLERTECRTSFATTHNAPFHIFQRGYGAQPMCDWRDQILDIPRCVLAILTGLHRTLIRPHRHS